LCKNSPALCVENFLSCFAVTRIFTVHNKKAIPRSRRPQASAEKILIDNMPIGKRHFSLSAPSNRYFRSEVSAKQARKLQCHIENSIPTAQLDAAAGFWRRGEFMFRIYGKYWWLFLFRGVLATIFGLVALFLPGITLKVMTVLLGAFLVVDGLTSFFVSVRSRGKGLHGGALLLEGLAGIIVGVLTFIWPGITVLALVLIVGFWAMVTGVLEIIAAVALRHEIEGEWLLGLSGIVSILFSAILFVQPGVGAVAIVWMIGVYALFFGLAMVFLGLRLRKHNLIINI
jgi:uncharacterized membrane protein HdeD (DUF308 family)